MSSFFFYTLFYFLISECIIYPPTEFVSAGLTIKHIFANWLGSENEFFVEYHIKRSVINLLVHSMLPFGYMLGLFLCGYIEMEDVLSASNNSLWLTITACTAIGPLYFVYKAFNWFKNKWDTHPIARSLSVYCNNNTTWKDVASNINVEYRRVDKIAIDTNSITRVVATDNWIIKTTLYEIQIAHQSDTALIVNKSDTHAMSPSTRGEVQFLNIEVKPTRPGSCSFDIRLNALDFKDLQNKVSRPITVLQNVIFHKTLLDRFIDIFEEQVMQNPYYDTEQELDRCIGCMQSMSNVKLTKRCTSNTEHNGAEKCNMCYCRPMWCIECMAKWFASRQDEEAPETWLSSKCTCPVCRAKFCLLDVCLVRTSDR